ncbi:LysR family transcriptional regulator [Sphingomonas solaris]|nr:LysR family transcriptional regulator [Sphingomonas solaris]
MKFSQLKALNTIARVGSIQRAARELAISQPALSKSIRTLELEFGVPLLRRSAKGVSLTEFGQAAVKRSQTIHKEMDRLSDEICWLKNERNGRLSIGITPLCSGPVLADAVAHMQHDHPGVDISLTESRSNQILGGLRDGLFDLGLVTGVGEAPPSGGTILKRFSTRLLIGRADFSGSKSIDQLLAERWIDIDVSDEQNYISTLFKDEERRPARIFQCTSVSMAVDLAPRLGAIIYLVEAALPFFSRLIEDGMLTPIETDFLLPAVNVYLVKSEGSMLSPAAERFVRFLTRDSQ